MAPVENHCSRAIATVQAVREVSQRETIAASQTGKYIMIPRGSVRKPSSHWRKPNQGDFFILKNFYFSVKRWCLSSGAWERKVTLRTGN